MTNVYTLNSTPTPERLVCAAARNDYSTEPPEALHGGYYQKTMRGTTVDREVANEVYGGVKSSPDAWSRASFRANYREVQTRSLLKHLMDSGHWGPFEHPSATLVLEDVTRVAMAQITRHRHFTFDIMSLRYCDVSDESVDERFEVPPEVADGEAVDREGVHDIDPYAENEMKQAYIDSIESYQRLLDQGVPREEARKVLPMGTKVNIVMSGNLRAWLHLLNIRGKANVQGEARRLADQIHECLAMWAPYTLEYYDEEKLPMQLNP